MHLRYNRVFTIDSNRLSEPEYYLLVLLNIYEKDISSSTSYRSRYINHRMKCPYFTYCILNKSLHSFLDVNESFPSPLHVFKEKCVCLNCVAACDVCGRSGSTLTMIRDSLVIHHMKDGALPNSGPLWYKDFGILCVSCNIKDGWKKAKEAYDKAFP